ncbi:MAG TPA: hypothetical protein VF458_07520 [Ktedonobacteraceae bacterium]
MSVEIMISGDTWRLRAYLGVSADSQRASLEEAFAALFAAERIATRYQLSERCAAPRCAYVAPWGKHCRSQASTPGLFGFLTTNPDPRQRLEFLACWPFYGRLCSRHQEHLVVPAPSWWPEEASEREAVLA